MSARIFTPVNLVDTPIHFVPGRKYREVDSYNETIHHSVVKRVLFFKRTFDFQNRVDT